MVPGASRWSCSAPCRRARRTESGVATTLAEVLRHFGPAYLRSHGLSTAQARAWRAIVACRTPALGGQRLRCDGCGAEQWRWHSCRNRHCPQCQSRARDAWRAARLAELLDVPYCHLVFTLPHELNALAAVHARWVYDTLMRCAAATLSEFAANPRWLGGVGAFTLVLHTWTQDLRRHLHVHALMACGALQHGADSAGPGTWIEPRRASSFLFPVHALSRVFRGKFMQALQGRCKPGRCPAIRRTPTPCGGGECRLCAGTTGWSTPRRRWPGRRRCSTTWRATRTARPSATSGSWASTPARCGCGCAPTRAAPGERSRCDGAQFIGRLLQHVLPPGFKRIRHYGLLAPATKADRLARARQLLAMPAANPQAREDAQAFMRRVAAIEIECCPHCSIGRWRVLQHVAADRPALNSITTPTACRGPP